MEEKIEKSSSEKQINLGAILVILKRNIIPIVLVTLLFGLGSYLFSKYFIQKQYSASAVLIVNNKSADRSNYNATELTAAQDLAEVYAIIIRSDRVLQKVIESQQLDGMTPSKLSKMITVSAVNKTQVLKVTMTHPSAEYAEKVMQGVVQVAPDIVKEAVEAGSVKVISEVKIDNNGNPVSPNLRRNAIIGALAGLALILLIIFLRHMINNKFLTEEDIVETLHVPLIGIIPEVDGKEFRKS